MQNTNKLNTAVELVKYANIFETLSKYSPDFVKNYRPLSFQDSWKGGLVAGGLGALEGAAIGSIRNRFRPKEERKKHNDALFYGALGGLGLGLPVAFAPTIFEKNLPALVDMWQPANLKERILKGIATHPWLKDDIMNIVKETAPKTTLGEVFEAGRLVQRLEGK